MHVALEILAVVLCGLLDRVRGAPKPKIPDVIEGALYAVPVYYLITGTLDWLFVPFAIAFWVGTVFGGWGHPINLALFGDLRYDKDSKPEWWQFGIFLSNPWAALALRGLMWGAPFIPLAYWLPEVLAVGFAFAVAMPLAVRLARFWRAFKHTDAGLWAKQEYIRGWLVGLILWVMI